MNDDLDSLDREALMTLARAIGDENKSLRARLALGEGELTPLARDRLLATLSHELQTPLSCLLMWIQVLRQTSDEDMRRRAIDALEDNARVQSRLIDELLELARGAKQRLELHVLAPVDMGSLLLTAVEAIGPWATEREIEVRCHIEERCLVDGDEGRLRQIVDNLLSNALKFTAAGGLVVASARREAGEVIVRVRDDGEGIDAGFLPHVFEQFRQERGASRDRRGLGLGLAIAQELTLLHHGRLDASSEGKGKGATFTMTLPLSQTSLASEATNN